ncbi:phosphogluconate dehydrogenase C-terminal domain-containing protein [Arhodomonas aquaeolei]|uniref:phosphogluconate dehydrogenase C-terminal domain-containing protein n=1 Tax=Arhodomonas aquaeolei TaxID=2369 RepID=UPI0003729C26|nr:phosphogluconate dehydrogenase C-terminal domain-containing protein [Arhodomonas aquaeolei]
MTAITLIGAGGKMGYRLSRNLKSSEFETRHVENSPQARERLKADLGVDCMDVDEALAGTDAVILAVPDTLIGKVSHAIDDKLAAGTMVVTLDAAAPFAGHLPERDDLVYFVTHPCHPSIFNYEPTEEAQRDFFGGLAAKQNIVSALMQGPEESWALGEEIARTIYAPVNRSHRVSVEHMAILEPGLSETVAATLFATLREALDECVARGVSREAARDFVLGHANIELAVLFEEIDGVFSDAANKAIENGKPAIIRDDWKQVFEPEAIRESIRRIT